LQRLQRKAAKNEPDPEDAKRALWKIIRKVFDVRNHRLTHTCDDASYQTYPQRKTYGVINVVDKGTAD